MPFVLVVELGNQLKFAALYSLGNIVAHVGRNCIQNDMATILSMLAHSVLAWMALGECVSMPAIVWEGGKHKSAKHFSFIG